jgi:hypothetical protein
MKKFTLTVALILTISLALVGCGGGGGGSSSSSNNKTVYEFKLYFNNQPLSNTGKQLRFSYTTPDGRVVNTNWSQDDKLTITFDKKGTYSVDNIYFRRIGDTDDGTAANFVVQTYIFTINKLVGRENKRLYMVGRTGTDGVVNITDMEDRIGW